MIKIDRGGGNRDKQRITNEGLRAAADSA